jgi:hypothetical protein
MPVRAHLATACLPLPPNLPVLSAARVCHWLHWPYSRAAPYSLVGHRPGCLFLACLSRLGHLSHALPAVSACRYRHGLLANCRGALLAPLGPSTSGQALVDRCEPQIDTASASPMRLDLGASATGHPPWYSPHLCTKMPRSAVSKRLDPPPPPTSCAHLPPSGLPLAFPYFFTVVHRGWHPSPASFLPM